MKFSAVVGNPPYQEKKEGTSDNPIYHIFYDISFSLANKVTLITPARFLYNAGKTPAEWNNKILNDPHVKVIWCKGTDEVFPNVDIKGGIAVTYRDNQQEFGKIGIFTKHDELNEILSKVLLKKGNKSLSDLVYAPESYKFSQLLHERYPWAKDRLSSGHLYDITSNIFEKLPELFTETQQEGFVGFYGRLNNERCYRWIYRNLIDNHENLDFYKVILPKSNGSGSLGEVLTNPIVGRPLIGHTQTFISIGKFETEEEAEALLKYIKTRLLRTLLGILKVTQDNKKSVWAYIPLQDFTSNSDIDWSKSVAEIDQQLYKKYGLSQDEQDFIESMIKPME
jgi:hypothetical protein